MQAVFEMGVSANEVISVITESFVGSKEFASFLKGVAGGGSTGAAVASTGSAASTAVTTAATGKGFSGTNEGSVAGSD